MTKRHRQLLAHKAELESRRNVLTKEGQTIGDTAEQEKRQFTAGERKRRDDILAELDEIKSDLDSVSSDIEAEARLEAHERGDILREAGRIDRPASTLSSPYEFSSFGEFLQAVVVANSPILASRWGKQSELLMQKLTAYQAAASGMSVGVPADGGFVVRKDWSMAMMDRAREQATLLPRTRGIEIGADFDGLEYPYIDETSRATGSRWGGVQVFRKAEAATVSAKQPKIGKGELRLEEIMGLAYATERLLRDASALQGILTDSFESEFAFTIDNEIIRGTGTGQCLGIMAAPCFVSQAAEGGQTAGTVVKENVLKMYARMPARLKPGAVWLIHPDVMTQLPVMAIGQQPVWVPPGGLANAPLGTLLGKPVIEIEQAEALGTLGDIMLVNLNQYVTITKAGEGLRADTSMHVRFLFDEMAFRWVFRINGQPTWRAALTPFKGSNTLSPFIGLANR